MLKSPGSGFARAMLIALNARPLWLALGIANVSVGVLIALRLDQSPDVRLVAEWCRDWLVHGVSPYPGPEFRTNYPPYALVLLSPLAVLPQSLLKGTWAIISVALAVLAGWLGLKVTPFQLPSGHGGVRLSVGFFLAWEALRIGLGLGQFTLVALAGGLAAVLCSGKAARGILLGVAMIKPQVGAAFALWAIFEGSAIAVLIAAVPIVAGTIVFAARLGQNPFTVVALYADVLRHQLNSPGFREGALELRPLVHGLIVNPAIADAVHIGIVAGTLGLIVLAHRRMSPASRALFLLPLTCLWTLMSIYHPSYDLVLLWPVTVALSNWQGHVRPNAMRLAAITLVQLALLVDIPGLWWRLNGRPVSPDPAGAVATAILHFDRLLVLALFATVVTVSMRWQPARLRSVETLPTHAVPAS